MKKLVLIVSVLLLVFTFNLGTYSLGVVVAGECEPPPPPPPPEPPPSPDPPTPPSTSVSLGVSNERNDTRVDVRYGNLPEINMIPGKLYDVTYILPIPAFAGPFDLTKDRWFGVYSYIGPVWNRVDFHEIGVAIIKSYDMAKRYFQKELGKDVEVKYTIHLTDQNRGVSYGLVSAGTASGPDAGAGMTVGPSYTTVKFRPHAIIQWWAIKIIP